VLFSLAAFLEGAIGWVPRAWQPESLFGRPIPGLGILFAVGSVLLVGLLTESFVGRRVVSLYEAVLLRVPLVSSLYGGIKQLMEQLFRSNKGFEQVVLVEWPRRGLYSVAFKTGAAPVRRADGVAMVNVFLPSTPNPTTGFYFMLPEADVIDTPMTVEEAFKMIVSAGIVSPELPLELGKSDG
jgi:uncharacterized membrane protein